MIENVIPVLIKVESNNLYRVMNISYENDGSIYFSFPSKAGLFVKNALETQYTSEPSQRKLHLKDLGKEYRIPKLSFHPRDFTVHLKSSENETILGDYRLYNFARDEGCFLCPVFNIGCPSIPHFFDKYEKKKYAHPLVIDTDNFATNIRIICVVHSQEYTLGPDFLDEMLPNRDKNNSLFCVEKVEINTPYTVTLYFTYFKNQTNTMILGVNTVKHFVSYSFECRNTQ